jgi:hypothetical protein
MAQFSYGIQDARSLRRWLLIIIRITKDKVDVIRLSELLNDRQELYYRIFGPRTAHSPQHAIIPCLEANTNTRYWQFLPTNQRNEELLPIFSAARRIGRTFDRRLDFVMAGHNRDRCHLI